MSVRVSSSSEKDGGVWRIHCCARLRVARQSPQRLAGRHDPANGPRRPCAGCGTGGSAARARTRHSRGVCSHDSRSSTWTSPRQEVRVGHQFPQRCTPRCARKRANSSETGRRGQRRLDRGVHAGAVHLVNPGDRMFVSDPIFLSDAETTAGSVGPRRPPRLEIVVPRARSPASRASCKAAHFPAGPVLAGYNRRFLPGAAVAEVSQLRNPPLNANRTSRDFGGAVLQEQLPRRGKPK